MAVDGISFGCVPRKNLNVEARGVKEMAEELFARIDKPVLKFKDGYLISTGEECEAFIKWIEENGNETEKKLLKTARYNLSQLKEKARELLTSKKEEINPNDPFHVVKKALRPNTANLMKRAYGEIGPENICREYVHLKKEAKKGAPNDIYSAMTKTKFTEGYNVPSKYSPMYSKYRYNA